MNCSNNLIKFNLYRFFCNIPYLGILKIFLMKEIKGINTSNITLTYKIIFK